MFYAVICSVHYGRIVFTDMTDAGGTRTRSFLGRLRGALAQKLFRMRKWESPDIECKKNPLEGVDLCHMPTPIAPIQQY